MVILFYDYDLVPGRVQINRKAIGECFKRKRGEGDGRELSCVEDEKVMQTRRGHFHICDGTSKQPNGE